MNKSSYSIKLKSGVTLEVTPLSFPARKALGAASQVKFPDPDTAPFTKKVEHAADPGMTYVDKDDVEYKRLWAEVKARREQFITNSAIKASVRMADADQQADVIKAYSDYLAQMRDIGVEMTDDVWLDTLLFGLLGFEDEYNIIMRGINGSLPLTETEIANAVVQFRTVV